MLETKTETETQKQLNWLKKIITINHDTQRAKGQKGQITTDCLISPAIETIE